MHLVPRCQCVALHLAPCRRSPLLSKQILTVCHSALDITRRLQRRIQSGRRVTYRVPGGVPRRGGLWKWSTNPTGYYSILYCTIQCSSPFVTCHIKIDSNKSLRTTRPIMIGHRLTVHTVVNAGPMYNRPINIFGSIFCQMTQKNIRQ